MLRFLLAVVCLGACRAPADPDACRTAADCVLVQEDACGNASPCEEAMTSLTHARRDLRHAQDARKDCEPGKPKTCTQGANDFVAECGGGRCVVRKLPRIAGAWQVVAFHRGDQVSRDPRSTLKLVFTVDEVTFSGETTTEVTTTTGSKPVVSTWSVTGKMLRSGDVLSIAWNDLPAGPARESLEGWTTLRGNVSQARVDARAPRLFLHRLDVDASLELTAAE